jgi:hypothetical protein
MHSFIVDERETKPLTCCRPSGGWPTLEVTKNRGWKTTITSSGKPASSFTT